MKYSFNFYTSYNQFYIADRKFYELVNTGDADFWNDDAFNDRLASQKNVLGVSTECYGNVKGELIVLDKPNLDLEYSKYDHVVESGVVVESGALQILDCPNSSVELEIKVKPGNYKVRIYSSNLASVIDDDGDDYYKIEIWESDDMEKKVLKRYTTK